MRWSDRQIAMLREMGIRLWTPAGVEDDDVLTSSEVRAAPSISADPLPPSSMASAVSPVSFRDHPQRVSPIADRPSTAAVATLDWPALRDAVTQCTACKLCEGRRQTVFGVGNLSAHWMIVGEAPGEQEDLQGEPFVGKSGQLLDNMLRAIALTRADAEPHQQVYIANTVKCRPPGNRNPAPEELAKCEPFLIRQLQLVQPRIILAMGRFAVQSLLRSDEPIGRLRGRVHQYQGVPLIVTYHPAYLLRNPEDKSKAWDDLCLATETARKVSQEIPQET
jgi:uracil-DNA glycosylase family 4